MNYISFGLKTYALAGLTGLLTLSSCASKPPVGPPPPSISSPYGSAPLPNEASSAVAYKVGVPGEAVVNTLNLTARVEVIDKVARTATLLREDGSRFTVKVGAEAINFDQVKVGDWVNLTVTEELVVYLNTVGAPQNDQSAALVALSPKGGKPGGFFAETAQITGTILAIDPANHTVTLQLEDGSSKTFPVSRDVVLSKHYVGEQVVFRFTKMMAISVRKPWKY
ncbi:MAG: hypothetical protein PHD43_19180 [Methylococcales bacterium]|nr:hypothetical protein [Methylococcales bacterium]